MYIDKDKIEEISIEVVRTLKTRFDKFPEDAQQNRNAPFHEAFLKAFSNKLENTKIEIPYLISLSSWLHGLNTTLGQSFFENVANILSDGIKMKFTNKNSLKVNQAQKSAIEEIITDLRAGISKPDIKREEQQISNLTNDLLVDALGFSADNFVEDDSEIVAIELKTVRLNAGEMRGEKQKILYGKAALKRKEPHKKIKFCLGFPFDPLNEHSTGFDKQRFFNSIIEFRKYFHPDEVLLADELWDFLSGHKNTMADLLSIINDIATVDFEEEYNFIERGNYFDDKLFNSERFFINGRFTGFKNILEKWHLYSEVSLLEKIKEMQVKLRDENKSMKKDFIKFLKQPIFTIVEDKIEYNYNRKSKLNNIYEILFSQ
ncbi:MAG: TdeIII family type II restriction endonuclease [Candidatus Scalinduaceae bacterium]